MMTTGWNLFLSEELSRIQASSTKDWAAFSLEALGREFGADRKLKPCALPAERDKDTGDCPDASMDGWIGIRNTDSINRKSGFRLG
jgi:hypothetical protein